MGPKHPRGFTPAWRYIRIVSCDNLLLSSLYFSRNSWSLGWRPDMARIWRICLKVRGVVTKRMKMVKAMMDRPMLLNNTAYRNTRLLIMGLRMP